MEQSSTTRSNTFWFVGGCLLLTALLVLAIGAGAAYFFLFDAGSLRLAANPSPTSAAQATIDARATATLAPGVGVTPAPPNPLSANPLATLVGPGGAGAVDAKPALNIDVPAAIDQRPVPAAAHGYVDALLATDFPIHDFYEAAKRLGSFDVGPRTVTGPGYEIGARRTFSVDDEVVEAELMGITAHTYFWVDTTLELDPAAVSGAAQRFEDQYYGPLVDLFGQEWLPGVDGDPHFSVLHVGELESSTDELGHFDSGDEYPRAFYAGSNEQELVYLNMANVALGSELYYGTLVHEFQHLVQWYVDANETTWLNEGLSQLAEIYVGLDTAEAVDYLRDTDTRLTTWDYQAADVYAHYGASYLFVLYLWEQLGDEAIRELARHPANGMAAVAAVLGGYQPQTTLSELISAWAAANFLDDERAGSAYHYASLELQTPLTETGAKFTPFEVQKDIEQFGVHYVELDLVGEVSVSFAGDTVTSLLPVPPHTGEQMWYAPAQENVNGQLTRRFDLSGVETATLEFWTWYDLKFDLDYAYVSVSTDEGATWELLAPEAARPGEYGPAFNGRSRDIGDSEKGGWVQKRISLNPYVGQSILLRFELLTYYDSDALGFALDDISIPELQYAHGAEQDADGWQAAGFVQVGQFLPQYWSVSLIQEGETPTVSALTLDEYNQGRWTIDLGETGGTLAISAHTPFADEHASYWLSLD